MPIIITREAAEYFAKVASEVVAHVWAFIALTAVVYVGGVVVLYVWAILGWLAAGVLDLIGLPFWRLP